jgi:hypothetical protein
MGSISQTILTEPEIACQAIFVHYFALQAYSAAFEPEKKQRRQ